jgi:hypothetical protein
VYRAQVPGKAVKAINVGEAASTRGKNAQKRLIIASFHFSILRRQTSSRIS